MKHYLRDLFLAGLALLALSSCHSADPEKEAEKLNEQFTELINSIDTNASPYTRYKYLLKIKDTADSLFSKGRTGFKKKKLALYRQNVIEITDKNTRTPGHQCRRTTRQKCQHFLPMFG